MHFACLLSNYFCTMLVLLQIRFRHFIWMRIRNFILHDFACLTIVYFKVIYVIKYYLKCNAIFHLKLYYKDFFLTDFLYRFYHFISSLFTSPAFTNIFFTVNSPALRIMPRVMIITPAVITHWIMVKYVTLYFYFFITKAE